jgi:hypothetical protein
MRSELVAAVAGLFAAERREPRLLGDHERRELVGLAALVARARSPSSGTGEPAKWSSCPEPKATPSSP